MEGSECDAPTAADSGETASFPACKGPGMCLDGTLLPAG